MGVEIQLAMADTLKRSVKAMRQVSTTGYMRINGNPQLLILGAQRDNHHGPVRIVLKEFERYNFTGYPFQLATFMFRLDDLDDFLDTIRHDDPIWLVIADRNPLALDIPFMFPDGQQAVISLTMYAYPIHVGVPPFIDPQLDGLRPFRITMIADLFMEPLLYCIIHNVPMTLLGIGPLVLVFVGDEVYSYENYTSIPAKYYVRFHLKLYRAPYIRTACADEFNDLITFQTAEPAVNPDLPLVITFPVMRNLGQEHLVYYLPSGSTVNPEVYVHMVNP